MANPVAKVSDLSTVLSATQVSTEPMNAELLPQRAVGYLGMVAARRGELAAAAELLAQSAAIAHEVDWPWWELFQLSNLADSERRLGLFAEAEGHASRALRLALGLGDRMSSVFAGAELASAAAARGDSTLAGRLWGAIESEEAIAPIGQ